MLGCLPSLPEPQFPHLLNGAEMAISKLTSCYFMEVVLATGKLWVAEFRDLRGETKAYPTLLTPSLLKQRITASLLRARDRLR